MLAVAVRALHLFPILGVANALNPPTQRVPCGQQIVCWFSGLRGAIAVALAYQVSGDNLGGTANNKHVIRAATMMVVVFTTFAFGGSTPCLLSSLKVPMGVDAPEEDESTAKPFEEYLIDPDASKPAESYKQLTA